MSSQSNVVGFLKAVGSYPAGSIGTMMRASEDCASYEIEVGDGSGDIITVPATLVSRLSAADLEECVHISDPETVDTILRLADRLKLSPAEVLKNTLRDALERGIPVPRDHTISR